MEDIILCKYHDALENGIEGSGVRSPLLPPYRPLYGREARDLRDDELDERRGVWL